MRSTPKLIVHVLLAVGTFSLYMTGEIPLPIIAVTVCAYAVKVFVRSNVMEEFVERNLGYLTFLFVAVFAAAVLFKIVSILHAAAEFILITSAFRILGPQQKRQLNQIVLLSLFEILAASTLTGDIYFGFVVIAYLFIVPWALILANLEGEPASQEIQDRLNRPDFVFFLSGFSTMAAVMTAMFFFIFPRFTLSLVKPVMLEEHFVAGFSDEVKLGDTGKILQNMPVVMRFVPHSSDGWKDKVFYLRGRVYTVYQQGLWKRSNYKVRSVRRVNARDVYLEKSPFAGHESAADIYFEVLFTDNLFVPYGTVYLSRLKKALSTNDVWELFPRAGMGVPPVYTVEGSLLQQNYILPPVYDEPPEYNLFISSQLKEELKEVVTRSWGVDFSSIGPDDVARYLKKHYSYTLKIERRDLQEDPVIDFLVHVRKGHCELFASAMVLILRTLGIPARFITGFLVHEWNDIGDYFVVRERNAHTWVEYFDGQYWRAIDPTPTAELISVKSAGTLWEFFDTLKLWWMEYVLEYSLKKQMEFVQRAGVKITRGGEGRIARIYEWVRAHNRLVVVILVFAGIAFFFWRKTGSAFPRIRRRSPLGKVAGEYVKILREIARASGIQYSPGETPLEYLRKVRHLLDADFEAELYSATQKFYLMVYRGINWPEALSVFGRLRKRVRESVRRPC